MADPQPKKSEGMAESVTPQPKELEDWYAWDRNDRSMDHEELFELACDLGDALAVLVPQLLDQLRETQAISDARMIAAQAMTAERGALGERCHQLETALGWYADSENWKDTRTAWSPADHDGGNVARAALGDTPPPDTQIIQDEVAYYEATGRLLEPGSPESVEPSQDEVPTPHDEEWKRKAMGYAQELITLRPELDALGERCRQLEAALAALGDTPAPPEKEQS